MRLPKETIEETAKLYKELGNQRAVAEKMGIAQSVVSDRLKRASELGLNGTEPLLEGFRIAKTTAQYRDGKLVGEFVQQRLDIGGKFEMPEGHSVKGVSALVDADGRLVQKWIKTREEQSASDLMADMMDAYTRGEFDSISPAPVIKRESGQLEDSLTLYPFADLHVGLFSWGRETGTNWDLKISEEVHGKAIADMMDRSPNSRHGVILGGGDLIHSDNNENKTARSGNALQVDGRYQKVLMSAARLMVQAVDRALRKHEQVTVRILPGNHDEHAAVAVAYFLLAWFRDNARVTVDIDPSVFWWMRYGKVMLGATHGHTVKLQDMPQIMAHRRAEDWGATRFRYVHGFHIHHKSKYVTEGHGCICESHQTPTPQDAWHYASGFLSGRSMQSITYSPEFGEVSRVNVAVIDG